MDNAAALFGSLRSRGAALILGWIKEDRSEGVHLDFNEKTRDDGAADLSTPDKHHFAKALSGFANSRRQRTCTKTLLGSELCRLPAW